MSPTPIGGAQQGMASPPGEAMWSRTLSLDKVEQFKELQEVMEKKLMVTPRKKKAGQPRQDTTDKTKPPAAKSGPGKKRNRTPSSYLSEETDTQMSLANSSELTDGRSSTGDSDSCSQSEGETDASETRAEVDDTVGEVLDKDISHSKYCRKSLSFPYLPECNKNT